MSHARWDHWSPKRITRRAILRAVEPRPEGTWDREADLARIREAYAGYERVGRHRLWSTASRGYARLARELDARLASELRAAIEAQPGATVVDLGCGTGELAAVGSRLAGRWIGVDIREDAVAEARAAHPGVEFLTASADALPLEDASVDVVVARVLFSSLPSEALEHAVATEIRRLLRPGGRLVWLDIRYSNPTNREVHGLGRQRIGELFSGWSAHLEPAGLLPPIARRLGPTTALTYPLLAAVPLLRSHLLGHLGAPIRDVG